MAAGLLAGGTAVAAAPRDAVTAPAVHHRAAKPAALPNSTIARRDLLQLINAERAQADVGPLRLDGTLDAIAQARSKDMLARHYFSHHILGDGPWFGLLNRDHVQYRMAGENLARNNYLFFYPLARALWKTNLDLMRSAGHRANLLNAHFTKIGIGLAVQPGGDVTILTEEFVMP